MTKFLGLEWAPLHIPVERRLQTLAVCFYVFMFTIMGLCCWILLFSLAVWTKYGWVFAAGYGVYRLVDESPKRGGWNITWVKRLPIWKYFVDYFPISVVKTAELDPSRNYVMGIHPHGIIGMSCFGGLSTDGANFEGTFPGIRRFVCTLEQNYRPPFQRELILALGTIDCSKDSIRYALDNPAGGHAVVLMVGGAQEALDAHAGHYKLTMNKRKGFIKLAMTTGADLVPIFAFGENEVYDQVDNPEGSFLRRVQEFHKKCTGFTPPVFHGRGIFNYTMGFLPYRRPLHVVVGKPIPVTKVADPSVDDISKLHDSYKNGLVELFELHKQMYGVDEDSHIEFS